MIEREEEQPEIKVTDRRKFNLDGSIREGVEIQPEQPKTETQLSEPQIELADEIPAGEDDLTSFAEEADEEEFDASNIPGADDPASFINFLSTLATNAAASLGAMPHPATGQRAVDLETGKYWLDVMAMLKEKTQNNLHPQESRLLDGILGDLHAMFS